MALFIRKKKNGWRVYVEIILSLHCVVILIIDYVCERAGCEIRPFFISLPLEVIFIIFNCH